VQLKVASVAEEKRRRFDRTTDRDYVTDDDTVAAMVDRLGLLEPDHGQSIGKNGRLVALGNVPLADIELLIALTAAPAGAGAVSLTLKVLHFDGYKPLVEKAFYETAIV